MKLTKLEQSGFIFETEKGFRLALDIGSRTPVSKLEGVFVDAMIISHLHGDHLSIDQIRKLSPKDLYISGECRNALGVEESSSVITEIKSNTEIQVDDFKINIFNVDHGPNVSAPLKENFGFLITVQGQKIYFAGDMFYGSGIDVTNLEVDIVLLPVGTFYTFGPEEAFAFSKTFKKIGKIIPMHDRGNLEKTDEFIKLSEKDFLVEKFV